MQNLLLGVNVGLSASSESIYQTKQNRSRGNSIRHRPHRVSSRRNKENGSGSFRKKNSLKKSNAFNDNVKSLTSTIKNSSNNSNNNGDKILKVSFQSKSQLIDSTCNKSQATPIKVSPVNQMDQVQTQQGQSFSRKSASKLV